MNLLLLSADEIDAGVARIGGRRARHIAGVLRAEPGQVLRAGIERGPLCRAEVIDASRERATLRVEALAETPPPPTIDLVLAMPRPKVLSRALQTAASLGVRRIDVVNAWRVDKAYLSSKRLEPDALADELRLGCEQGATTWVPEIQVHPLLMPFLDRLDVRGRRPVIAHPGADAPIESVIRPGDRTPVTVAVGPDRGWIDREIASFADLGFSAVCFGAGVLKVEAAVAALLSTIELLQRLDQQL